MTITAALKLVFGTAEAAANGHEKCIEILKAVEQCKEWVNVAQLGTERKKQINKALAG